MKQIQVNDYVYVNGEADEIFLVDAIGSKQISLLNLKGYSHGLEPIEKVHHWEDYIEDLFKKFAQSDSNYPDADSLYFMNRYIVDLSELKIPGFKEKILDIFRRNIWHK